ncbi:unnamed protein product [Victoria cruziana]
MVRYRLTRRLGLQEITKLAPKIYFPIGSGIRNHRHRRLPTYLLGLLFRSPRGAPFLRHDKPLSTSSGANRFFYY